MLQVASILRVWSIPEVPIVSQIRARIGSWRLMVAMLLVKVHAELSDIKC
jgi:hypothetical protein